MATEIDNEIVEVDQNRPENSAYFQQQQSFNLFNLKLPYSGSLEEEAARLYSSIKTNLVKSVLAQEIYPGCIKWMSLLKQYIKFYGFKFPKEDHIAFIKMFYEILIIPDYELPRIDACCTTLITLLDKKRVISRDELQLDWRPLYDLCIATVKKRKTYPQMFRYCEAYANTLYNTVRECRFYFPASATKEILDELQSKLNPCFLHSLTSYMSYFEIFLPIAVKPEEIDISHKLWLDDIINLSFEKRFQDITWDNHILRLLGGLARFQMGYINWEPYVPIMYARIQRFLQLPVHLKSDSVTKQHAISFNSVAQWVIYTLHAKNSTFFHFEKLIQVITSYFYPANSGAWSAGLKQLLTKLTHLFVQRVYFERYKKPSWETNFPESAKLSDDDIDKFIDILHVCLEPAIFSGMRTGEITSALSDLASLRPHKILPLILDKLYPALDSLTEPNKLISCLTAAIATGRFLVNGLHNSYPDGPTHVIMLLRALLPGIDKNDGRKALVTFHFISSIIMMVPMIDSSKAYEHYNDLTETEHMICESSAGFEDFILEFFEKIFVYIESSTLDIVRLEQLTSSRSKFSVDVLSVKILGNMSTIILNQLSPAIYMKALKKFYNFALESTFEIHVAGKMVAVLAGCFCAVNPKEVLKLFLPKLFDALEENFNENPNIINEEHIDSKFLYNLLLLSKVVNGRDELLLYMDKLTMILDKTLHVTCLEASQLAAQMLEEIIVSLSDIQPLDFKSSNVSYDKPIEEFLSIREWGKSEAIKQETINWYVPKEREINMVQELITKYLAPELDKLNKYSTGQDDITRQELKCSLRIITAILAGHLLMPMWDEPECQTEDSVLDAIPLEMMVIDKSLFVTMPDGGNIRKAIVDTLHRVQCKLLQIDEDDTKSILDILHIYDILLTHSIDNDFGWLKAFYPSKAIPTDRLHRQKKFLRFITIERVLNYHKKRIANRSNSFTETHKQIIIDLFDLSVSRYRDIRSVAQCQLFNMLFLFPFSYVVLTSKIKETLKLDPAEYREQFKGCLSVVQAIRDSPLLLRNDWNFLKEIWPAILQSIPSEEPSVIKFISSITDRANGYFPTFAINLAMTDKALQAAYNLANNSEFKCDLIEWQSNIDNGNAYLQQMSVKRKADYNQLVNSILGICQTGKLHWRYQKMGTVFLKCLIHKDVNYNASTVRFFLQSLIDESSTIRNSALQAVVYVMVQNKPIFEKKEIDPYSFTNKSDQDESKSKAVNTVQSILLSPGERADNKWFLYKTTALCQSSEEWDDAIFVHSQTVGYYRWPKPTLIYPTNQKSTLSRIDDISDTENEIYIFFKNEDNIKKMIDYYSMEENGRLNKFFHNRSIILKNMFKMFEDEFLQIFLDHLTKLIDGRPSQHRYASEIISAIIAGSKHWSYDKIEQMWDLIIPILNKAINKMTCESFSDWSFCIFNAIKSRDPRSCYWLLEYLMLDPLNDVTTFTTCNRLRLLCAAIDQSWRNKELFHRLLRYLLPHLGHPFQNVREYISFALSHIFAYDILSVLDTHNYPKIGDFYGAIAPQLNMLSIYILTTLVGSPSGITPAEVIGVNVSEAEVNETLRMFITVSQFTSYIMLQIKFSTRTEYFQLLPLAAILQNYDKNAEVKESAEQLLFILCEALTSAEYIPDAIEAIKLTAACPLWSARAIICEFVSVFVFHNMPIINSNKEWILEIQNVALQLLEDSHPEVGQAAIKLTSGLLHTNFISNQTELLDTFKQKAKTALKRTHSANKEKNNFITRHSGVMGLCSFIKAHPYDVPDYLPELFSSLRINLSDPQPISGTIRKTMGEFKRTHQDNWEEHKLKFTPDELSVLNDLSIPPSYFV